jgi:hypothetical protein
MNHHDIAIIYGPNITATNARATREEETNETAPMDNFVSRGGSLDPN